MKKVMSIAGHVSKKMLQHYSHVRLEAKRDALDALTMGRGKKSNLSLHRTVTTQRTTQMCPLTMSTVRKLLNFWWS